MLKELDLFHGVLAHELAQTEMVLHIKTQETASPQEEQQARLDNSVVLQQTESNHSPMADDRCQNWKITEEDTTLTEHATVHTAFASAWGGLDAEVSQNAGRNSYLLEFEMLGV